MCEPADLQLLARMYQRIMEQLVADEWFCKRK